MWRVDNDKCSVAGEGGETCGGRTDDTKLMSLLGVCIGRKVEVLILIMRWPQVWGEGGVSWCYWILGVAFCGAYRTDALSPGHKTWYLNYALYGLPLSTPL